MMIEAVDRRAAVSPPDPWAPAQAAWSKLVELAGGIGPADWRVDLVLVDDEAMGDLNRRWREGPGVTDVLSFTYLEDDGSGSPSLQEGSEDAARDLWLPPAAAAEDESPLVGEVVLAPAFIAGRCGEQGWDTDLEWPLLLAHGCLHLLGWEHHTPQLRRVMAQRETEHLQRVGLPHPLRERS